MNDVSENHSKAKRVKCTVRDGRFVEPCDTLSEAVDVLSPAFSRGKGVFRQEYTNTTTGKPSRVFFGIKSNRFKRGLLFNNCPWCGERIDEPFREDD